MDWWVNIHTEINSRNSTIFQQFTIIELHLCCFFLSCRCLLNSNCPRKLKTLIFEYRRYSSCLGLMIVANSLPVGYYGLLANKGATAFSIMVDNSPLTFVCCHLSPHSHNVKLRNQELERYFLRSNTIVGFLMKSSSRTVCWRSNRIFYWYFFEEFLSQSTSSTEFTHSQLFYINSRSATSTIG